MLIFNGKIEAQVQGLPVRPIYMDGGAGVLELGMRINPSPDSVFSINVGAERYIGQREGVTGSLQLRYTF